MSFLAGIPGLLPMVLLTAVGLAIVVIPILVVGIALGVLLALAWLAARIVSRIASFITGTRQRARGLRSAQEGPRTPVPVWRFHQELRIQER
jgi:MFS superfamily sulfate permease-like transporter